MLGGLATGRNTRRSSSLKMALEDAMDCADLVAGRALQSWSSIMSDEARVVERGLVERGMAAADQGAATAAADGIKLLAQLDEEHRA